MCMFWCRALKCKKNTDILFWQEEHEFHLFMEMYETCLAIYSHSCISRKRMTTYYRWCYCVKFTCEPGASGGRPSIIWGGKGSKQGGHSHTSYVSRDVTRLTDSSLEVASQDTWYVWGLCRKWCITFIMCCICVNPTLLWRFHFRCLLLIVSWSFWVARDTAVNDV